MDKINTHVWSIHISFFFLYHCTLFLCIIILVRCSHVEPTHTFFYLPLHIFLCIITPISMYIYYMISEIFGKTNIWIKSIHMYNLCIYIYIYIIFFFTITLIFTYNKTCFYAYIIITSLITCVFMHHMSPSFLLWQISTWSTHITFFNFYHYTYFYV